MTAEDSLALRESADELERELQQEREKAQAAKAASDAAKAGDGESGIHWIPLTISAAALIGGSIMAFMYNKKAKEEKDAFDSELAAGDDTGYHDHEQNAQDFQQNRAIGIGIAIAGAIGIGLSFLF
jgi:hypothetical protein